MKKKNLAKYLDRELELLKEFEKNRKKILGNFQKEQTELRESYSFSIFKPWNKEILKLKSELTLIRSCLEISRMTQKNDRDSMRNYVEFLSGKKS